MIDIEQRRMTNTNTKQTHVKVDEVAARLGVTRATVYTWVRNKELPAFKLGRTLLISLADLEQIIENRTTRKGDEKQ
jgi:excisionase family DNA binding protein